MPDLKGTHAVPCIPFASHPPGILLLPDSNATHTGMVVSLEGRERRTLRGLKVNEADLNVARKTQFT